MKTMEKRSLRSTVMLVFSLLLFQTVSYGASKEEVVWLSCTAQGTNTSSHRRGTELNAPQKMGWGGIYIFNAHSKSLSEYSGQSQTLTRLPVTMSDEVLVVESTLGPSSSGLSHSILSIDRRSMAYNYTVHWQAPAGETEGDYADGQFNGVCEKIDPRPVRVNQF